MHRRAGKGLTGGELGGCWGFPCLDPADSQSPERSTGPPPSPHHHHQQQQLSQLLNCYQVVQHLRCCSYCIRLSPNFMQKKKSLDLCNTLFNSRYLLFDWLLCLQATSVETHHEEESPLGVYSCSAASPVSTVQGVLYV